MVKIYKQPFAHDGDAIAIPDASQPDGKMSSADGWTTDYQLPKTDPNYKPVGRQEMNGVFKEVTEALGQVQVQGAASWSADGAPYPINAQVYHNGKRWMALRANSVEPAEGEDWTEFSIRPGPDHHALFSLDDKLVWRPTKRFLTAPLTLYISPNGDDENDGFHIDNPKKTLEAAFGDLKYIDSGGHRVEIVALPGEYGEDGIYQMVYLPYLPSGLSIRSYSNNPNDTIFKGRINFNSSGTLYLEGLGFVFYNHAGADVSEGGTLIASSGATLQITNCEITAPANSTVFYSAGAQVNIYETLTLNAPSGARLAILINLSGSVFFGAGSALQVNGNYVQVVSVDDAGSLTFFQSSASGNATGVRYGVTLNGIINTRGGGEHFIPGSTNGETATGGQYV